MHVPMIKCHISRANLVHIIGYRIFLKFEISFDRKDTVMTIRWVTYAARDTSEHFDIYKEGYETLKQQWMHIIMTQYCIIQADLANKMVLYFA